MSKIFGLLADEMTKTAQGQTNIYEIGNRNFEGTSKKDRDQWSPLASDIDTGKHKHESLEVWTKLS